MRKIIASIIIPVFNQVEFTKNCIASLIQNINQKYFDYKNANYEIIIVNNASTDSTLQFLSTLGGNIKVITNNENLGFSKACNIGAKYADGKYIVLLNNDTIILKNWLEALVDFAENNPKAGAVGSKIIYPSGKLQEAGCVIYSDGTACAFGNGDDPNKIIYNIPCPVDYVSGASLLFRKDIWDKLNGLDEENFSPAYYEETDMCFSIRKLGYQVYYQPASAILHFGQVTANKCQEDGLFVSKYLSINKEKFINKWKETLSSHPLNPAQGGKILTTQNRDYILNVK